MGLAAVRWGSQKAETGPHGETWGESSNRSLGLQWTSATGSRCPLFHMTVPIFAEWNSGGNGDSGNRRRERWPLTEAVMPTGRSASGMTSKTGNTSESWIKEVVHMMTTAEQKSMMPIRSYFTHAYTHTHTRFITGRSIQNINAPLRLKIIHPLKSFRTYFSAHLQFPWSDLTQWRFTEYLLCAKTNLMYLLLVCTTCKTFAVRRI